MLYSDQPQVETMGETTLGSGTFSQRLELPQLKAEGNHHAKKIYEYQIPNPRESYLGHQETRVNYNETSLLGE